MAIWGEKEGAGPEDGQDAPTLQVRAVSACARAFVCVMVQYLSTIWSPSTSTYQTNNNRHRFA